MLILSCGCLQTAPAPAPVPTVTSTVDVIIIPETTTLVTMEKQINITATETKTEVIVQYNGGPDAADLVTLKIRVNNQDDTTILRTITNPVVGAEYIFTYHGNANANVVNIVGVFTGGFEQTVLMAYL
jgi:hypothetical protein